MLTLSVKPALILLKLNPGYRIRPCSNRKVAFNRKSFILLRLA